MRVLNHRLYEAFDFNQVDNTKTHKAKIMSNVAMAAAQKEAIKLTDISKVVYTLLGIDKPRGWKVGTFPVNDFPAYYVTDKPMNSKPVHDLMKLMEIKGWTRLSVQLMNRIKMGKTTPDDEKIKDKINEDWFKYFDKDFRPAKNSEDQTREIWVSPDNGMMFIWFEGKWWNNNDIYLTFTGEKVYNDEETTSMSADEKTEELEKNKAIALFRKVMKNTYKINLPITAQFNYDKETKIPSAHWEWSWTPGKLTASSDILGMLNKKIIRGQGSKPWKKTIADPYHWRWISPGNDIVCDIEWVAAVRKGYLNISHKQEGHDYDDKGIIQLKRNRKGKVIVEPAWPGSKITTFEQALEDITDYFTDEELKVIEKSDNPFNALIAAFKEKWMKNNE